jgi:hypothetical protein
MATEKIIISSRTFRMGKRSQSFNLEMTNLKLDRITSYSRSTTEMTRTKTIDDVFESQENHRKSSKENRPINHFFSTEDCTNVDETRKINFESHSVKVEQNKIPDLKDLISFERRHSSDNVFERNERMKSFPFPTTIRARSDCQLKSCDLILTLEKQIFFFHNLNDKNLSESKSFEFSDESCTVENRPSMTKHKFSRNLNVSTFPKASNNISLQNLFLSDTTLNQANAIFLEKNNELKCDDFNSADAIQKSIENVETKNSSEIIEITQELANVNGSNVPSQSNREASSSQQNSPPNSNSEHNELNDANQSRLNKIVLQVFKYSLLN